MDFETLLYIFFIVISIIASIARGSSKKKGDKSSSAPKKDMFDFEKWIEQSGDEEETQPETQFDYDEVDEPATTREPSRQAFEEPAYVNYDSDYEDVKETYYREEAKQKLEQQRREKEKREKEAEELEELTSKFEKGPETEESEYAGHFEFDPVKAVIYSEILKRPEW